MTELDLYHPLITARNKEPWFFTKEHQGEYQGRLIKAYNPVCGDEYDIAIEFDLSDIRKITFSGYGCAVSKAALDMLIERLQYHKFIDIIPEIEYYLQVIEMDQPPPVEAYPLSVFQKVKYHPARKECATLGANSLLSFLKELNIT
jgi:nitrogen fixation NifU-like protein